MLFDTQLGSSRTCTHMLDIYSYEYRKYLLRFTKVEVICENAIVEGEMS